MSKYPQYAVSGIVNGHWEPIPRRSKILAVAREGIAKLLGTVDHQTASQETRQRNDEHYTRH